MKFLQRVKFWIKIFTTRHQILKKYIFLKSVIFKKKFFKNTILKKKLILKSSLLKKFCTQRITFWFNLPRKMRKFWVLRAILKSTILKKKNFLEGMILNVIFFLKSMILIEKFFVESFILDETFFSSDFELNILQRVRLSVLLLQFAKFSCVHWNKARFGNVWIHAVGSVSQVILLGKALCTPTVINVTTIHIKTANLVRVCSSIYLDREWYLTRLY